MEYTIEETNMLKGVSQLLLGLHMYALLDLTMCHNITCRFVPDSPSGFHTATDDRWRCESWDQGYNVHTFQYNLLKVSGKLVYFIL